MSEQYPHSIFTVAHTDIRVQPRNNHERTLRLVVATNIDAEAVSVVFSNRAGEKPVPVGAATLAMCDEDGDLIPDTLMPLTVGGVLAFELQPGEDLLSDSVRFPLKAGDQFAISLFYPTNERVNSGNWVGGNAYRTHPGNFTTSLKLPAKGLLSRISRTLMDSDMTVGVTSISQIIATGAQKRRVLACFGDSITQQGNWTTPFTKRLFKKYPGEISVCNLGISGNQLLGDSPPGLGKLNGEAGVSRFDHDVLGLSGLTHAILAIGSNDVGLPGSYGLPAHPIITLEAYSEAMASLAEKLRAKGVRVYAATITPRAYVPPYAPDRELLRLQFNEWIRSAPCFDAVLDFDAVVKRDDGGVGMKEGYALPDGLHPSLYGGMRIAKSIDLSLFGEDT